MRASSFCERILPLLNQSHLENPENLYMLDTAPCHKTYSKNEVLHQVGITPIRWPPCSGPELDRVILELVRKFYLGE
ncbi:Bgt-20553 [Blumeria graminis f. sp. tritici]|uniref:Bgt-20553 n=2 Tax=Blumeria graminis f. sp. tritici TaxID=62690 RepID=A0A9X9MJV8_BLUGR|nr:Bgt-20553 [Blumeria graminis f. sp. tritici]